MIKLFFYRSSQAASLQEAVQDGNIRYVSRMENKTMADLEAIVQMKLIIKVVEESLQGTDDDIVFIEEEMD